MNRREFITLLSGTAVGWPLAARAQKTDQMRRIGVLMGWPESDTEAQSALAAFVQALQQLGWASGRNARIDIRWTTSTDAESMQRFAKELVALQPELILSHTTPTTAMLLQQTRTIPIIFAVVADPVGSGFVASLPRPGGNVTGFVITEGSLGGKWVELLKEVAPRVARIAFLFNPATATYAEYYLKGTSNNVRGHKFGLGPVFDCLPGFFFRPLLRLEHCRRLHRLHAAASRSSVTRRRML
jgi:putative ABC transport system substrate-binding protein